VAGHVAPNLWTFLAPKIASSKNINQLAAGVQSARLWRLIARSIGRSVSLSGMASCIQCHLQDGSESPQGEMKQSTLVPPIRRGAGRHDIHSSTL